MKVFAIGLLLVNAAYLFWQWHLTGVGYGFTGFLSVVAAIFLWKNLDGRNGFCIFVGILAIARPIYILGQHSQQGKFVIDDPENLGILILVGIWVALWVLFFAYIVKTRNEIYKI